MVAWGFGGQGWILRRCSSSDPSESTSTTEATPLFFRSIILFRSCWVLLGFVLWVMLFRSWNRESWSWFWVVMLFGSWDRESFFCWEWMGELGFINKRVRDDNLYFLFFGVLVMGLSSWMLGLIWEEQVVKWRTRRNFLISVSFFLSFHLCCCNLGLTYWLLGLCSCNLGLSSCC